MNVCDSPAWIHSPPSGNSNQFPLIQPLCSHCYSWGLDGIPLIARGSAGPKSKPTATTSPIHTANPVSLMCSVDAAWRDSRKTSRKRMKILHYPAPIRVTMELPCRGPSVGKKPSPIGITWATNPDPADATYLRMSGHLSYYLTFCLSSYRLVQVRFSVSCNCKTPVSFLWPIIALSRS